MRLELSHPQPPTATTGTTNIIEMYQCVRQASTAPSPQNLARAHHASPPAPPSARGPALPTPARAARARRRRTNNTNARPAKTIATPRMISGERRLGALGRPVELPGDRALAGADRDRHLPVEDQCALALVLDLRRRYRRHPVDAVVVPFELAGAVDYLPFGRVARIGARRDGHVGVEARVQVASPANARSARRCRWRARERRARLRIRRS